MVETVETTSRHEVESAGGCGKGNMVQLTDVIYCDQMNRRELWHCDNRYGERLRTQNTDRILQELRTDKEDT
jgi:hypothetical protein